MRTLLIIIAANLLGLVLFVGNFAFWLDREVITLDDFVRSTEIALGQKSSHDAIGQMIVNQMVDDYPLLIILEPNLVSTFSDMLGRPALGEVITLVAVDFHERIMTGNRDAIVLDVLRHRDTILSPLEATAPRLVDLVPDSWFVSIDVLEAGALPDLSPYARSAEPVAFVSLAIAGLLAALLLWLVQRTGTGVSLIGIAFVLAAIATGVLVSGGRGLTITGVDGEETRIVIVNMYDQFTGPLFVSASVLLIVGVALLALGLVIRASEMSRVD